MRKSKLAVLLIAALAGAACKTARAATPVERPNLEVPPPPPRIIEPVTVPEPEPEPAVEPPAASGAKPKPAPPPVKPETKPDSPPEPATPPAAPPSQPPPQLRTPGMPSGAEAARQVQAILDRAAGMLKTVHYQGLSRERRNSYDTARRFMEEGERELKAHNYVLARELAEKAERLAKELQGR